MVSIFHPSKIRPAITTKAVDYATQKHLIHSIRTAVFVDEQNIPADFEIDHDDPISQHVLAFCQGEAIGTGRLTAAGKIGRVSVLRPFRRQGVGLCVMHRLVTLAKRGHHSEVVLSAQCHAIPFYEKLGFQPEGSVFSEAGIAHVKMRKQLRRTAPAAAPRNDCHRHFGWQEA